MSDPVVLTRKSEAWDEIAKNYSVVATTFTQLFARDALNLVGCGAGVNLLDVGAGSGALSLTAAGLGARVTATDFSPGMLEALRKLAQTRALENVETHQMDGQALEFPDDTFDFACSAFGLQFFPDRAKGFRELLRVLKPDGRGVVLSWGPRKTFLWLPLLPPILGRFAPNYVRRKTVAPFLELEDPGRLEQEMTDAGFRDVKVTTVTHVFQTPSAEWTWQNIQNLSPGFANLLDLIGRENLETAGEMFAEICREKMGDPPYRFPADGHIGIGTKT